MFRRSRTAIPVLRLVILHTKDGRSFYGVLVARYADGIVLRHAKMLPAGEDVIGDLIVPMENASWLQADVPDDLFKE